MKVFGTKLKCFGPFAICSRSMFLYILVHRDHYDDDEEEEEDNYDDDDDDDETSLHLSLRVSS